MKHNLLSLFLAAIVAMNMYATDVWDGSSDIFTHGSGTEASPYLIENAEQLAFIAELVNAGVTTYSGNYFKLTTDLDLNNIPWTPIGTETSQFGGNFDGGNHVISKLNITSATNAGLFGVVSGGSYRRLTIQGTIPASANATNAGGIIAYATAAANVDSCYNKVDIGGGTHVGGILGYALNLSISNCVNFVSIKGTVHIGGIVGYAPNTTRTQFTSCINYGSITATKTTSKDAKSYVGGMVGEGINIDIREFENFGNISGEKNATLSSELGAWKINNCRNCQDYKCDIDIQSYLGGVVGKLSNSVISSCYNSGNITCSSKIEGTYLYSRAVYDSNNFLSDMHLSVYYLTNKCNAGGCVGLLSDTEINRFFNKGNVASVYSIVSCPYSVRKNYYWGRTCNLDNQGDPDRTDTEKHVHALSVTCENYTGGVVGKSSTINVSYCVNTGTSMLSGVIGYGTNTSVNYCANTGNVAEAGVGSNANVHCSYSTSETGSVGISNGTVTNSYYINGSGNGTQKTEAQMKSASMPILLNADSIVFIQDIRPNVNKGYPIFKNGMRYVATNAATDVSYTTASLHGNYYNCAPDSMGFEYKTGSGNYSSITVANIHGATDSLQNLTQGTTYIARFWLSDGGVVYYGDTIQFTTLQCPTEPVRTDTVYICQGETYEFAGRTLSASGIYRDSLVATTGCDSVIELDLRIFDTYKYTRFDTITRGESYDFYGVMLTESGIYNEYIRTTNRCNWIELHLFVKGPNRQVALAVNDTTMGTVAGGGIFEEGSLVDIVATPKTGYRFVRWSDANTEAERVIVLSQDTILTAIFEAIKYPVVFRNEDNTPLQIDTIAYGTMPEYRGATPTKTSTAQYSYTFAGWTPTISIVTGAATYTATFSEKINKYVVIFRDEDSTLLQLDTLAYGTLPSYRGITPSKTATAQYTYTFAGWSPSVVSVTGVATYTATYTARVNKYLVVFANEDGSELQRDSLEYGVVPAFRGVTPSKQATAQYTYVFAGWTPAISSVTGAATYTATFTAVVNKYLVTFVNEDGTELQRDTLDYGATPAFRGITPSKQADAQYSYSFAGWSPAIGMVTGHATYTATYTSTVNKYVIRFCDESGTFLQIDTLDYGAIPVYRGLTPSKQATAQFSYTFAGWSPAITSVSGAVTYTATFNPIVNKYAIVFVGEDGTELQRDTLDYGSVPAYRGAEPTKQATDEFTYSFVGWTPNIAEVTGDATYSATFDSIVNTYIIMFLNSDSTLLQLDTLAYGAMPEYRGEDPVKPMEGEYFFIFTGWEPSVVAVTGDATYIATYESHGTGVAIPNETKKPAKIWQNGKMYILLSNGQVFDSTGKRVE